MKHYFVGECSDGSEENKGARNPLLVALDKLKKAGFHICVFPSPLAPRIHVKSVMLKRSFHCRAEIESKLHRIIPFFLFSSNNRERKKKKKKKKRKKERKKKMTKEKEKKKKKKKKKTERKKNRKKKKE